jgi:translation initiation factor IF-2
MPEAGDKFYVLEDLERARTVAQERRDADRARSLAAAPQNRTLQGLIDQIEAQERTELPLIVKADVQGSLEALTGSLEKLGSDEVRVSILHAAVGGISTGDVALAEASDAIIIGFNVVADTAARRSADSAGVEIRLYRVIYDLIEDVRRALEEGLAPEIREETLGRADIRQVFRVSRVGTVAGCIVTEGMVSRNANVRVIREDVVIADERELESLRRFKDDVREVRGGMECGLKIAGYDDLKEGDHLEFYRQVEVARRL